MNGMTSVMYEGAPDYPAQGHLVGALRALRRDGLLHGADRDPRVHEVGRRAPAAGRPVEAAAARHGRRADQPEGLALVLEADRRRALPGRRHLVADRDRQHHDHDAAGGAVRQARLGGQAAARASTPRCSTRRATRCPPASRACSRCAGRGRGCCARSYKDDERFKETYFSKWDETTYFVGDAARQDEDGYFWVVGRVDDVVNVSGHRLSTAEVESAIVSHPRWPRRR